MINVTEMLCGPKPQHDFRFGQIVDSPPESSSERKPVVIWNITRTCNLACIHCYADSYAEAYSHELTSAQGRALLAELAEFGVRDVVLSGGEPLVRRDTLELAEYGRGLGPEFTLATNGTLLDEETARSIRGIGFRYVAISLDGIGPDQ